MTTLRADIRIRAGVLLSIAAGLFLLLLVAPAFAQDGPEPSTPTTESTTTSSVVTTTTAAPSTTRAPSTTSPPRSTTSPPRSTPSTTAPTTTESSVVTTTTAAPAPEIVTDDTLPSRRDGSESSGLSTDTKLALVVGALSVVGIVIAVLTYFYWRHTRPQQYMSALDALADVEQKVPRDPDDIPTAQHAAIGPGAAAATAGGAASAVRVLEPEAASDTGEEPKSVDEVDAPADDAAVLDEPTKITTVEELEAERGSGGESSR